MSNHPELWKTLRWIALLAAMLLLALMGVRFMDRSVKGTSDGIDKVLSALTNADTRITEGRAEIVSQTDISELALLELRMSATRRFENDSYVLKYLPTGTKHLIAQGHYRITAGYKLEPGVSLRVENGTPIASFPEPEILGVELIDFEILSEKDGWANNITPADRATLLRELRQQMRIEAEKSGVLDLVETTLATRMRDLLAAQSVKIERTDSESP
ncbi:DUF4230 domain-containing protein [Haloferula rosea]|uniref:DUF4230 domain-containing protein n=1 Tax=Haloferula rosea TaxID=490093 RepID=A0A934RAZ7_9BACT|nr:DUF4230 domain-containing protein [Haloferula rosea]MBK1828374.1 DUF4230 domain-containing protein [Haloferula rosea]